MRTLGIGDEFSWIGCFVQTPELTQFAVGDDALDRFGELDVCEGKPEVFAKTGGNGFFAQKRELFYGVMVLERGGLG